MESALKHDSVTVTQTFADLARSVSLMISSARREIFFAPRYYEPAIGNKILTKFSEGVTLHVLDANTCGVAFEKRLRSASLHDTKNRDLILKMLDMPDLISEVERLDYSFIVVDGRHCCIELVNPASPDNFNCALTLESEDLGRELIRIFYSLAQSGRVSKSSSAPTPYESRTNGVSI